MIFLDLLNHYLFLLNLSKTSTQEEELLTLWGFLILKECTSKEETKSVGLSLQTLIYYRESHNSSLKVSSYNLNFILQRLGAQFIDNPFKGEDAKPYFVGVGSV